MRELVTRLVEGIVREPGRIRVRERTERERVFVELGVAPADRGRVIGRSGRTASALRTLLGAVAHRQGRSCELEILD